MKRYTIIFLVLISLVACNSAPEGFKLEGTLKGEVENGSEVYLRKTDDNNNLIEVDTTLIENGAFNFKGTTESPELGYLFFSAISGNIPVMLENGTIKVSAQKDSLTYASIKGTPQNQFFSDFLKENKGWAERARSMSKEMEEAVKRKDTVTMTALRDEYFELQQESKTFELKFAKENPNALISALILDKVYTTKSIPETQVQEIYDGFTPLIKETVVGKRISNKLVKSASTRIGGKAPDFSGPTPDGEQLALYDVLGKVTILDFWAAWCKPCRAENPNVVNVYNKYHEKGLNIVGVSLDRRSEDWKKAIVDDGLNWNHISNVNYFDEIAALYNVSAIPATFILDENGIIIAKDLRGVALENKIAELLD